jgi:DNA-binding transcriptional ArsR family regulator
VPARPSTSSSASIASFGPQSYLTVEDHRVGDDTPCVFSSVSLALPFVETYRDGGLGLLGDPTRRAIFELLARRPCSVGELAQQLPISRPAVSQHLRVLKDGGLVVSQAEGTRRVYRLNPDGVAALRAWLDRVWDEALTAFQKAAEATVVDPQQEDL